MTECCEPPSLFNFPTALMKVDLPCVRDDGSLPSGRSCCPGLGYVLCMRSIFIWI
jgi:hypothetical protein